MNSILASCKGQHRIFIAIGICMLVSCIAALWMTFLRHPDVIAVDMNHSLALSPQEIAQLKMDIQGGDALAASRLAFFYGAVEHAPHLEVLWLRKGAEMGDPSAQYNLAYILVHDPKLKNYSEANAWLMRAEDTASRQKDAELIGFIHSLREEMMQGKR